MPSTCYFRKLGTKLGDILRGQLPVSREEQQISDALTEQKRLKTHRYRARLATRPWRWKAYLLKGLNRKGKARANAKLQLNVIVKASGKQAAQDMKKRTSKV